MGLLEELMESLRDRRALSGVLRWLKAARAAKAMPSDNAHCELPKLATA